MKPMIGITCSMGQNIYSMTMANIPQMQSRLNDTYVQAILQAGGIPVILPSYEDLDSIPELVERLDGILLSDACCDVYNPKVLRSSMGGVFRMPLLRVGNMTRAIVDLQ